MSSSEEEAVSHLDAIEREVIDVFVSGVRMLGMPPSLGEIYGLLFISAMPLALDDVVRKLRISKGSASQGLRALRELGAIREVEGNGERRTYFEPAVELRRLVGGFIREQIRPHLDRGKGRISRLSELAAADQDPARREFLADRVDKLEQWMRRGRLVLPVLQRFLGE